MKTILITLLSFSIATGQTIPIGSSGVSGSCGTPVTTNLKAWYSADCMTATSPCATSYANGHTFTTSQTWLDRSTNSNTLTIDSNQLQCQYNTNKINSLPAVSFGGADGSGNCGWLPSASWDTGATSWAIFVVLQNIDTNSGVIWGPFLGGAPVGSVLYINNDGGTKLEGFIKSGVVDLGQNNTATNTNWNQVSVQFSNQADQNLLTFRLNRAADGNSTPNATVTAGTAAEIGVDKVNGSYAAALHGRIAELLIYSGTGAILSAGNITTNETYLNCRYGL